MISCPHCGSLAVFVIEVRLSEHPHVAEQVRGCAGCQTRWSGIDFRVEDPDPRLIQWPRPWSIRIAA